MKVSTKSQVAKEELDNNSSTTDFIAEVAKCAAKFINDNRSAFNTDDASAVKELADVFTVADVQEAILAAMSAPVEEEKSEEVDTTSEETATAENSETIDTEETNSSSDDNDDLVSQDVMALLDE